MSITKEISDFISKNGGNERDALNVALAKIKALERTVRDSEGAIPEPLETPDFSELKSDCRAYLVSVKDPENNRFKNVKNSIFETAVEAIYGKDIWDWIQEQQD